MPAIRGDEARRNALREMGRIGAMGAAYDVAAFPVSVEQRVSYGKQLASAFRTENLAVVLARGGGQHFFGEDPGFNPADQLGEYAAFTDRYPQLLRARSGAELASVKNRIDRDVEDRERLQGMGFGRSLLVYLPAGLLSPENLLPIGGALNAVRAGGAAVKAARVAGRAAGGAAARTAGQVGVEAAISQGIAEAVLQPSQPLRTTQEGLQNVVGAALFGSVLGGAGGALGASHRALLKAAIGAESVAQAGTKATAAVLGPAGVLREGSEAGVKFRLALDEFDRMVEAGEAPAARATMERITGMLVDAVSLENPNLGRILKFDQALGNLVTKVSFINPAARLATNKLQTANIFSDILVKNLLREQGVDTAAIEPLLQRLQLHLYLAENEATAIYSRNRAVMGDVNEDQFNELVGFAASRQDQVKDGDTYLRSDLSDEDPYAVLRDEEGKLDQAKVQVVEEAARHHREFQDGVKRLAHRAGAFTESQLDLATQKALSEGIEDTYLSRMMARPFADENKRALERAVAKGLEHQRELNVDSGELDKKIALFDQHIERRQNQLQQVNKRNDPERSAQLKNEIESWEALKKDAELLKEQLTDPDQFQDLVISVTRNYLGDAAVDQIGGGGTQSALRARVLRVQDRFLEGFLIKDVRTARARMVRSVVPDLVLADRFSKYWSNRDLLGETGARVEKLKQRFQQFEKDGTVARANFRGFQDEAEELLVQSQILGLVDNVRLMEDFTTMGGGSLREVQERIYEAGDSRARLQRGLRRRRREELDFIADNADLIEERRAALEEAFGKGPQANLKYANAKRSKTLPPEIEELDQAVAPLLNARKAQKRLTKQLQENTKLLRQMATRIVKQKGNVGLGIEDLTFKSTRFLAFEGQTGDEIGQDLLQQLRIEFEVMVDRVAQARRASFHHNVSTAQMIRAMEREARDKVSSGEFTQQQANRYLYGRRGSQQNPAPGGAVHDLNTLVRRLRARAGVGEGHWKHAGKALRDLNFTRAMGGVVISSIPDMAMAIGQAGLYNYALTLKHYVAGEWKIASESPQGRGALALMQWAMEDVIALERHRTNFGLHAESISAPPGHSLSRGQRFARTTDRLTELYSKLTLIQKWNAINKAIAGQAIQHRIADVAVRLSKGQGVRKGELALVQSWVGGEDTLKRMAAEIEKHGEKSGRFYYSRSQMWDDQLLAEQFDAGVFKAVADTIITRGAGDSPTFTDGTFGQLFWQFRHFTSAATHRMLIPAIQRFGAFQDPGVAMQMAVMWMLGISVYGINEYLKGRDPFQEIEGRDGVKRGAWRQMVVEGLDRSGVLGILSEVNATVERTFGYGLTSFANTEQLSRFRSRSPAEAAAGPGFGMLFDLLKAPAAIADGDISAGDASFMRRLVPGQNLFYLRLALDVAPSAVVGQNFFEDFKPIEQRILAPFMAEE